MRRALLLVLIVSGLGCRSVSSSSSGSPGALKAGFEVGVLVGAGHAEPLRRERALLDGVADEPDVLPHDAAGAASGLVQDVSPVFLLK